MRMLWNRKHGVKKILLNVSFMIPFLLLGRVGEKLFDQGDMCSLSLLLVSAALFMIYDTFNTIWLKSAQ